MRVTLIAALAVLGLYVGRLVQVQGFEGATLAADAFSERSTTIKLPAHRGNIVDVNGSVLATTVEQWNLQIDQTLIPEYSVKEGGHRRKLGVEGAAAKLAPIIGLSVAETRKRMTGKRRGAYLIKGISPEVYRKVVQARVVGVFGEQDSTRKYPNNAVGASLVGFVSKDGRPLSGVEKAFATELAGKDGKISYETSGDARKVQIPTGLTHEVEPQDGRTVRLTLDVDLQWKAQQALAAKVAESKAESGVAVIMDARTGEVLALATVPTFDSNNPGKSPAADRGNRGLLDVFEPGSTAKVITAAAAVEEKVATPTTRLVVPGSIHRSNTTIHDSEAHGREQLTFAGVLAKSSNIGTVMVGERMSEQTIYDYQSAFGFGQATHVGLPESRGILTKPEHMWGTQRYTVMFGQGVSVTALQAVSVYQTIANDGVRVPPRLVAGTTAADGARQDAARPAGVRVVSPQTAQTVRMMLEGVTADGGTGTKGTIPGYRVAGKTGTAQAADPECGCYRGYTASFIGFAPADQPRLVMGVFLQRPKVGRYGGQLAAPVFQEVMSYALLHRGIAPTGAKPPVVPITWP
jgi:cell division protein FtsI (penicillin-binding protein 3)